MAKLETFAHDAPLWFVAIFLLSAMVMACEFGAMARRRLAHLPRSRADHGVDEGYILTAVLGLLALLIAFTFSLALDRYNSRRELVVTEANALTVVYQRARLLDDPAPLQGLLREYARERLLYGERWGPAEGRVLQRADELQEQIWTEAVKQARPVLETMASSLVIEPLSAAFEAAGSRKAALAARLPLSVLAALSIYAIVSAGILGYAMIGAGGRHRVATFVLFGLITLVIVLIFDLDQPRSGWIVVPQAPMADALRAMGG